jgi:AraC-like DNA-binding protein
MSMQQSALPEPFETILYEKKGAAAYVTLNRPKGMNALNQKAISELRAAFEDAQVAATPIVSPALSAVHTACLLPGQSPPALAAVARLLQEAGKLLWNDTDKAQLCIEEAIALLRKEPSAARTATGLPSRSDSCQLAPWQVARVASYIDANLTGKITSQQLAEATRLSISYFCRAFRSTIGESPHTFVVRRRIGRARELIGSTDQPLSQIALDCGLADQAHLSKLFRRVVGVSPAAWRKMHGDPPTESADRRPEFAVTRRMI